MNIAWDAEKYSSDFSFVPQYGSGVMELIDFDRAKTAIDLGCGNGILSKALAERGLKVIGIDSSVPQLQKARQDYPDLTFLEADAVNFTVDEPVDVVFSNAVFHWIDAQLQDQMLKNVAKALKPGGQFVFEFGGRGCAGRIHTKLGEIFARHGYDYPATFYFPTIGEYAPKVEAAGMEVRTALLFERPTATKGQEGLKDWILMFDKAPFEIVKDEWEKMEIIDTAVEELKDELYHDGIWYVDYMRIRMKAIKK